jgi:hypothetical protein
MGRHGFRLRCLPAALGLALFAGEVHAVDVDGDFYFDETTPKAVLALQDCGADENTPAHRKPFAGGYVFAIKCASNNENLHRDADLLRTRGWHRRLAPEISSAGEARRRHRRRSAEYQVGRRDERDRRHLRRP